MKSSIFNILLITLLSITCTDNKSQSAKRNIRVVRSGLDYPWEIIWGPDDHIWMTERDGRISCVDPGTGATLFSHVVEEAEARNEGGMLGMALHPDFLKNGYLYVVYNYNRSGEHLEKLVRLTYKDKTLSAPFVLIDGIKGSTNHNGSRLWITHEEKPKIFISTGDAWDQSLPQQVNKLNGKILRLNIDGTIPPDNPFPSSAVWSYGHRNPQGLVMVKQMLYASEHGASTEDEINIIERGRNYGWPETEGPCDEPGEKKFCNEHNIKEPLWSTGNQTLAVCGLDYYPGDHIQQWRNSLLLMTLKNSNIIQLKLSENGKSIVETKSWFNNDWGRLRDLCISPSGKVYVCTSNGNKDRIIEIGGL